MTLTAWSFVVSELLSGRRIGQAVLSPQARYASAVAAGSHPRLGLSLERPEASRIDRLHLSPRQWQDVEAQIALGLEPGPLDGASPIAVAISGDHAKDVIIQYVVQHTLQIERPEDAAAVLDEKLRA